MSFTKAWAQIKIFPWRLSAFWMASPLTIIRTHIHDDHDGARVGPTGVSLGCPGPWLPLLHTQHTHTVTNLQQIHYSDSLKLSKKSFDFLSCFFYVFENVSLHISSSIMSLKTFLVLSLTTSSDWITSLIASLIMSSASDTSSIESLVMSSVTSSWVSSSRFWFFCLLKRIFIWLNVLRYVGFGNNQKAKCSFEELLLEHFAWLWNIITIALQLSGLGLEIGLDNLDCNNIMWYCTANLLNTLSQNAHEYYHPPLHRHLDNIDKLSTFSLK